MEIDGTWVQMTYHAIARLQIRALRHQPIEDFWFIHHLFAQGVITGVAPRWVRRELSKQRTREWAGRTSFWIRIKPVDVEIREDGVPVACLMLPREVAMPVITRGDRHIVTSAFARPLVRGPG